MDHACTKSETIASLKRQTGSQNRRIRKLEDFALDTKRIVVGNGTKGLIEIVDGMVAELAEVSKRQATTEGIKEAMDKWQARLLTILSIAGGALLLFQGIIPFVRSLTLGSP